MRVNCFNALKMTKYLRCNFLSFFLTVGLFCGCANMKAPTGGPKDVTPPKVVKERPSNLTRNFSVSKIQIEFDEFVKLNNEFSEISISPAVEKLPSFKAFKKNLEVKFSNPLEENTTYTINFGKAIVDVNEGNVLTNYSYVFSTGNQIDSLSISGNVKHAVTGSKLKDVMVFILPTRQDSLLGKKNPHIFTQTDSAGNFSLKNLKADAYRIYALKKTGGSDRIFNSYTDEIAFLNNSIVLDSNVVDVKLNLFKEIPAKLRNTKNRIESDGRIELVFNKSVSDVVITQPANVDPQKIVEFSSQRDTLFVWLPELFFDSLKVVASSKDQSKDTVTVTRDKRDTYTRSLFISDNVSNNQLKPRTDYALKVSSPTSQFDLSKITLLQDSIPMTNFKLFKDSLSTRKFVFKFPWKAKKNYILTIGDSTFTDNFNTKSKKFTRKFKLGSEDDYGNIAMDIQVPDTLKSYLIQWLDEKQAVLRTDAISQHAVIKYSSYPAGKYSLRVIYDANKNGEWDTGNVSQKRQPERVWNYDKIITLRPNWDLEEKIIIPGDQ